MHQFLKFILFCSKIKKNKNKFNKLVHLVGLL